MTIFALFLAAPATVAARTVAVTVDDLPFVGPSPRDKRTVVANMRKLVTQVRQVGAPVVGFVVGRRRGDYDALAMWRDAQLPFGNHTFSHRRYSKTPIDRFILDATKNEDIVRRRLGVELRGGWFRYPYLDHGHTAEKLAAMTAYLKKGRYRHAPVSLATRDYSFNAFYARTTDPAVRQRIAAWYVEHVIECTKHVESLSRTLYGREIPLVLLVHANPLNADHLRKVIDVLKSRGYTTVSLEVALADKAYTDFGLSPPYLPLIRDRNFLNQVAASRGMKVADPAGSDHFRETWRPKLERLAADRR